MPLSAASSYFHSIIYKLNLTSRSKVMLPLQYGKMEVCNCKLGSKVFDLSEQDVSDLQMHIFRQHGRVPYQDIFRCQGRILKRLQIMPPSLASDSQHMPSALVLRHREVHKVKECFPEIDPEREMEFKERVERQIIRAKKLLDQKKEKVLHKYAESSSKDLQLTVAFLEDANNEGQKHPPELALPEAESSQAALPCKKKRSERNSKGKISEGLSSKISDGTKKPGKEDVNKQEEGGI